MVNIKEAVMKDGYEFGTVHSYASVTGKRFGLIVPDAGLPRIFFHIQNLQCSQEDRMPKKGDRVIFMRGEPNERGPRVKEFEFDPFVSYGDVCHQQLGTTSQDGAKYVGGLLETPDLSDGIRFEGSRAMYHSLRIHRDDVSRFVGRVKKWQRAKLNAKTVLIYMSDTEYFCSNVFDKESVPKGFKPEGRRLPIKIKPQQYLPDGIIVTPAQLLYFLGYVVVGAGARKHIPNPNSAYEPTYSGYYKKPE